MKKISFIYLLFLNCILHAQVVDQTAWCPPGARWVYQHIEMIGNRYSEYVYIKDTSIANTSYKLIKRRNIYYDYFANGERSVSDFSTTNILLNNINDSIYQYFPDQDSSVLLYIFNLQVGDSLVIKSNDICINYNDFPQYPDSSTLHVTNVINDTIGNFIYTTYVTDEEIQPHQLGKIINNIGPSISFFPSLNYNYCYPDPNEFLDIGIGKQNGLTCYYDDTRGYVARNKGECHNIITSTKEIHKPNIQLFPNPAKDFIQIQDLQAESIEHLIVYDLVGKKIKVFNYSSDSSYNVSDLPNGVYIIEMYKNNQLIYRSKIVKE